MAACAALGAADQPGDVALMLDYRIRHLLVDEMQDTSLGQYRLLEQLTAGWEAGDGRTLFCVGDPMQSIYRFRDAEVGRFVQAQRIGVGGVDLEPMTLRRNFRSGENLVHWFNTVFSQLMPREDDIDAGAIAYSESVPAATGDFMGECTVHPIIDATQDEEADAALQVVSECIRQFPADSKAILVRSRTHLTLLLAKLRQADIPYQAIEIDRLTDLPEIIDVLALTRALCHEADRLAWLSLLRGPWVGLNWQDIHALVKSDSMRTVPELAAEEARIAALSDDGRDRLHRFMTTMQLHRRCSAIESLRDCVEYRPIAWPTHS